MSCHLLTRVHKCLTSICRCYILQSYTKIYIVLAVSSYNSYKAECFTEVIGITKL